MHVHITVSKHHDEVGHATLLDAVGTESAKITFAEGCCEASGEISIPAGDFLVIANDGVSVPYAGITLQGQLAQVQQQLTVAQARITELETQLAAKAAKPRSGK